VVRKARELGVPAPTLEANVRLSPSGIMAQSAATVRDAFARATCRSGQIAGVIDHFSAKTLPPIPATLPCIQMSLA
jgi:hypothetical protein